MSGGVCFGSNGGLLNDHRQTSEGPNADPKPVLANVKPTEAKSSGDAVTTCYLWSMQCDEHYLTTFFKGFFAASVAATATLFAVGFVRQAVHPVGITPANFAAGVLVAFVHLVAPE